jgi:hypothetical protein
VGEALMSQPKDPIEERDILKFLDCLDDPRVQKKILSITKMEVMRMSGIMEGQKNANPKG